MHFDIIEAVRQKQQKQLRSISVENGKVVVRHRLERIDAKIDSVCDDLARKIDGARDGLGGVRLSYAPAS